MHMNCLNLNPSVRNSCTPSPLRYALTKKDRLEVELLCSCNVTKKRRWQDQTKNLTISAGLIKVVSLLNLLRQTTLCDLFSPNSSQNIHTCFHWSLDRDNSYTHRSAGQKNRIQNLHLAIHEKLQRAQSC
jgi:hypothetical protein